MRFAAYIRSLIFKAIAAQFRLPEVDGYKTYQDKKRGYVLETCAGKIYFKPKRQAQLDKYRNNFINRISVAKKSKEYFDLYRELRQTLEVSYSATFVTRLKGFRVWLFRV